MIAPNRPDSPRQPGVHSRGISQKIRIYFLLFTFIFAVGVDQTTKQWARTHLPRQGALSLLHDTLRLQCYENVGGIFSLEYSLDTQLHGTPFTVATSLFMGLLIVLLLAIPRIRITTVIALSLILGGSFSNFIDRITPPRIVVDFIDIGWGNARSNLFNLADAGIVIGLALLALALLAFMYGQMHNSTSR